MLTIVIPTGCTRLDHWTSKIIHIPTAPSTVMIESVIDNLNYHLFDQMINNYQIIIGMDYKDCEIDEIYYQNILKLKEKYKNIKIQKNYHNRWREDFRYSFSNNFYNMFEEVDTKYYLLMEHDWWFTKKIDINQIIETFDKYENINYLRFNHSKNIKGTAYTSTVADHFIFDENIKTMSLTKTDFFSNNPSIMRTSFMKTYLRPQTLLIHKDGPVEGPWSVMQRCCWTEFGFEQAHKLYGTYMYGKDGDESVIRHLDGNRWNP